MSSLTAPGPICGAVMRGQLDQGRMIMCWLEPGHDLHFGDRGWHEGRAQGSKTRGRWRWREGAEYHQFIDRGQVYNLRAGEGALPIGWSARGR
jgi:hypothetical protein